MEVHNRQRLRNRLRTGLGVLLTGFLVFLIGIRPAYFGLDRSPVIGFVQIAVFLVGLAVMCGGGYLVFNVLWNGREKSLLADIGFRLVSTGYLIAVMSGMADVFGIGSHRFPKVPYFGAVQAMGVLAGQVLIVLGFLMAIPLPYRLPTPMTRSRPSSTEQ
ncbi:MAG: hypothetical protein RML93_11490 [Anaerolineales bacterium]|nr:hypothetical protein [Anaerolineales bacterium]MDW8447900.1 hypothetical protein [Anaerolineales bacterium]